MNATLNLRAPQARELVFVFYFRADTSPALLAFLSITLSKLCVFYSRAESHSLYFDIRRRRQGKYSQLSCISLKFNTYSSLFRINALRINKV